LQPAQRRPVAALQRDAGQIVVTGRLVQDGQVGQPVTLPEMDQHRPVQRHRHHRHGQRAGLGVSLWLSGWIR
jgi:hypothetical protein